MYDLVSSQFGGQSLHFGINLVTAFICIAAGWLYLDAWSERHHPSELAKGGGFLLLAAAFILTGATWNDTGLINIIAQGLRLLGYLSVAAGLILTPLQPRPKIAGYTPTPKPVPASAPPPKPAPPTTPTPAVQVAPAQPTPTPAAAPAPAPSVPAPTTPPTPPLSLPAVAMIGATGLTTTLAFGLPIAALLVAALYLRIATIGLERHLKPLAVTFAVFALSEALALTSLWQTSSNPLLQPLAAPLGLFWILNHLTLLVGTILLGHWVWRYLAKRLFSQMFLTITSLSFAIVLFATVSVSALLLSSLQHDALGSLKTATKVLDYAIDSKTAVTRTNAEILAQNPAVITAAGTRDHAALSQLAGKLLVEKQLSEVVITDDSGVVLARGSDPERYGDSLSADSLAQRALIGTTTSSITSRPGAVAPTLVITTASPIRSGEQIWGLALTSLALDNAFVDGLKHKTDLDSTIYSGNIRAATTLTTGNTTARAIGTRETERGVLDQTLEKGQPWQGTITNAGRVYLAVYLPLVNVDNNVVGMLSVGQPQDAVLANARNAIKLTFSSAAGVLLLILLPVYFIARQISRQLQ